MTDKQSFKILEVLSREMSNVEQYVDWELALNPTGENDKDYFKAAKAIVEPRFEDEELFPEFEDLIENNSDVWAAMVRRASEGLVHGDKWSRFIPVFSEYGY